MMNNKSLLQWGAGLMGLLVVLGAVIYLQPLFFNTYSYTIGGVIDQIEPNTSVANDETDSSESAEDKSDQDSWQPIRVETPKPLYAIYMTSWVAGTPSIRSGLVELIKETKLNAVVIDIKDETGRISFAVEDEFLQEVGSQEVRIRDLREFIKELNEAGIYVIGRVSVFQDPYLAKRWPDQGVRSKATGDLWRDRKGLSWVDPGSRQVWRYVTAIGWEAYEAGFDEINYDYVRFLSDGVLGDTRLPLSEGRESSQVLEEFFAYLDEEFRTEGEPPDRPVISADVFGMVTTNYDDLGIGQILEKTFPYFDYIAPMVSPSHYPPTWLGLPDPAADPYRTIHYSLTAAAERAKAEASPIETLQSEPINPAATTTPQEPAVAEGGELELGPGEVLFSKEVYDPNIIRPWLQDFNLGATYTADMVRAQIDATYDAGLDSWMIWSPSNNYASTRGAIDR